MKIEAKKMGIEKNFDNRTIPFLFSLCIIIAFSTSAFAKAERIERIEVENSENTEVSAIISSSDLRIDQEVTEELIKEAEGRLGSNPIFEKVIVTINPGSDAEHVIIKIWVKEKISWFVVPTFSKSEGSLSAGATVVETNLFGRFKKAMVFADYGNVARHFAAAYRDPALFDSSFILAVDGLYRWDEMREYDDRREVRRVRLIERGCTILPGYQWSPHFSSSMGAYYRRISQRLKKSEPGLRPIDLTRGNDIAFLLKFNYSNTKSFEGLTEGSNIELESQLSDDRVFSDFNYFRQILRFGTAFGLMDHQLNLSSNMSVQLGRDLPYYYELMLGGGNLRGYLDREFRGDTKYTFQEQATFPIVDFSRYILRGVSFWDSGVLYFKNRHFSRSAWNNGIGSGLRLYLKGIAIPLIGYDIAYGIEDQAYSTYLSVGTTF